MSPSLDEEKRARAAKLVKELSPQELRVWQDATFRMIFIKNACALSGFTLGAVPFFLTRRGRWRLKAAASGTMGYLCFGAVLSPVHRFPCHFGSPRFHHLHFQF